MPEQKDGATILPSAARSMVLERVTEPLSVEDAPGSPTDAAKAKASRCCPEIGIGSLTNNQFCMENGLAPLIMQSCALGILLYEGAAYNLIYLRKILPAVGKEQLVLPFFIIFNLVYGLALWSYFKAHCSDPGLVPDRWKDFVEYVGTALPIAPARLEWQPGKATYCKKCSIARPERAHHCNVCGVCVLRMDHHCPWINNCVGFLNHKFFLLLVSYALLATLVALVTSLPELLYCTGALLKLQDSVFWQMPELQISEILIFLVFGALDLAFLVILAPMFAQHFHLATLNATTIEGHYDNMPNPFDMGATRQNLEQIFGALGPDWFFPVMPSRPLSDGVTFPRNYETLGADGLPQGIAREYGQPWAMQEKLWRVRYQVRPTPPAQESTQDSSLEQLMGLTGCYAPCAVARDVDNVIMPPQQRTNWH